jgi:hypothetical protein
MCSVYSAPAALEFGMSHYLAENEELYQKFINSDNYITKKERLYSDTPFVVDNIRIHSPYNLHLL